MAPPFTPPGDAPSVHPPTRPVVLLGAEPPTAARIRPVLGGLSRPLVCECGAVEGGGAVVGVVLYEVRGGWQITAACEACDPDAYPFGRVSRPGLARARPPSNPIPAHRSEGAQ